MSPALGTLKTVLQTNAKNSATVIFLHGSGDTGPGVYEWIEHLIGPFSFPHIKFIFPTAPLQDYTPSGGVKSRVWFDREAIDISSKERVKSIERIASEVRVLIEEEVSNGIPLKNIVIGGFSMGGALALQMGYYFTPALGGIFALSSFLNNDSRVFKHLEGYAVPKTPLLMYHGVRDRLVPFEWGKMTFEKLKNLGVEGNFFEVHNAMHELKKQEIEEVFSWIKQLL